MVQNYRRVTRSIRYSPQENKALELEAARLGINVHTLLRAELLPLLRRIRKRHVELVQHLPH